jgi:hypothetical protein
LTKFIPHFCLDVSYPYRLPLDARLILPLLFLGSHITIPNRKTMCRIFDISDKQFIS